MKKSRFAGLLVLAPLMLLTACTSTPELSFESNWLSYTAQQAVPVTNGEAIETLDYDVTFKRYESTLNAPFKVNYSNGKYHTELSSVSYPVDGKQEQVYRYTTSFEINVSFSLNGKDSETFTDTQTTEVIFMGVTQNLRPLSSTRTVESRVPLYTPNSKPKSLEESYAYFHYSYATDYSETNKAKITLTNLVRDENEEKNEEENANKTTEYNVSTKGKGSYFDNEQILFILRGLDLTASLSFRSIDPLTHNVSKIKVTDAPTAIKENCNFTTVSAMGNGLVSGELDAYEMSFGYAKSNAGAPQKCVYAKKINANGNTYRNVLLRYEQPVMYSHGTMEYKLKEAHFSNLQN